MMSGMAARICAGPSPCCDASAMMLAMSMMPVIPTRATANTLHSSHRIMRNRIVPNTRPPFPPSTSAGNPSQRLHHAGDQLLVELDLPVLAQLAAHLDLQQLPA